MLRILATAIALLVITTQAEARSATSKPDLANEFCGSYYCGRSFNLPIHEQAPKQAVRPPKCSHHGCQEARVKKPRRSPTREIEAGPAPMVNIAENATHNRSTQIVEHPAGCPSRAFCGCGVALKVFGKPVRELWLAANWFKFPPASPAPGMVAVRRHHVFAILQDLGNGTVLAYDPNSGGRKTRIHVRSLAGYSVRNPRA